MKKNSFEMNKDKEEDKKMISQQKKNQNKKHQKKKKNKIWRTIKKLLQM